MYRRPLLPQEKIGRGDPSRFFPEGGGDVCAQATPGLIFGILRYFFPQQILTICRTHFTVLMEMLLHFTKNWSLIPLNIFEKKCIVNLLSPNIYVVVHFLSRVIFVFLLFLGITRPVNEVETKEK